MWSDEERNQAVNEMRMWRCMCGVTKKENMINM